MKKAIFLFFVFVISAVVTKAQDIITLTDGSQIQAKVLEINPGDIKYKEFNNPDGPVITIRKDGVSMIQYANGTKTLFNDPYNKNQTPAPGSGYKRPENDRNKGRERYSSSGQGYKKRSDRNSRVSGWYFGAGVGLGASNATSNDPTYTTSGSVYSGLTIAATKMFNQHIGIQFGLTSETYSYDVNLLDGYTTQYGYASDNFSVNCFTLPVRVLYLSNSKKRVGLYASAGVDLSLRLTARDQEGDDISSAYNSAYISPYISCGVEFRNKSARTVWMFGPYYKTTIGNVYSNSDVLTGYTNNGLLSSAGLSITFMHKYSRGM